MIGATWRNGCVVSSMEKEEVITAKCTKSIINVYLALTVGDFHSAAVPYILQFSRLKNCYIASTKGQILTISDNDSVKKEMTDLFAR